MVELLAIEDSITVCLPIHKHKIRRSVFMFCKMTSANSSKLGNVSKGAYLL